MAITVSAKNLSQVTYNFAETSGTSVHNDVQSTVSTSLYTYGTGASGINVGIFNSGIVPSGSVVQIDLTALQNNRFGVSYNVPLSGIKTIGISNLSSVSGYDLNIRATGSNSFTSLFNGGSGNLLIKPNSAFVYNDPYGELRTSPTSKIISIRNVSTVANSGVSYSLTVLGTST